jgi:hypothetical protein
MSGRPRDSGGQHGSIDHNEFGGWCGIFAAIPQGFTPGTMTTGNPKRRPPSWNASVPSRFTPTSASTRRSQTSKPSERFRGHEYQHSLKGPNQVKPAPPRRRHELERKDRAWQRWRRWSATGGKTDSTCRAISSTRVSGRFQTEQGALLPILASFELSHMRQT